MKRIPVIIGVKVEILGTIKKRASQDSVTSEEYIEKLVERVILAQNEIK